MNEPVLSASAMPAAETAKKAHVIVLGNEKGGSGKTTTGMHLIVGLLRLGFNVGSMDIDSRQRSLSRYLENRRQTMLKESVNLPQPQHIVVQRSPFNIVQEAEEDERDRFTRALNKLSASNDFIVVDSPGSDTYLSHVAHAHADTVITPINDSFVDLDVLANVDGQTMKIIKPSIYSEMVWEQKLSRAKRDGGSIEWIVMRNRLSNIDAKNKRFMTQVTTELSRRIGFRVAPGFSERVIFREMFLQGLTVLDIMETGNNGGLSLSHVAARQEVRDLLRTLRIPLLDERIQKSKSDGEEKKEEAKPPAAPGPVIASDTAVQPPAVVAKEEPKLSTAAVAVEPEKPAPVLSAAPASANGIAKEEPKIPALSSVVSDASAIPTITAISPMISAETPATLPLGEPKPVPVKLEEKLAELAP